MTLRRFLSDYSIHTTVCLYVDDNFIEEEQIENLTTAYDKYEVINHRAKSEELSFFERKIYGIQYRTYIEVFVHL